MLDKTLDQFPSDIIRKIAYFLGEQGRPDDLFAYMSTCKKFYNAIKADVLGKYNPLLEQFRKHQAQIVKLQGIASEISEMVAKIQCEEKKDLGVQNERLKKIRSALITSGQVSINNDIFQFVKEIRNMPDDTYFRLSKKSLTLHFSTILAAIFLIIAAINIINLANQVQAIEQKNTDFYDSEAYDLAQQGLTWWGVSAGLLLLFEALKHYLAYPRYKKDTLQSQEIKRYLDCPIQYLTVLHGIKLFKYKLNYRNFFADNPMLTVQDVVNVLMKIYYSTISNPSVLFVECQNLIDIIETYLSTPDSHYSQEIMPKLPRQTFYNKLHSFFGKAKVWDDMTIENDLTIEEVALKV